MNYHRSTSNFIATCFLLLGIGMAGASQANDVLDVALQQGEVRSLALQAAAANSTDRIIVKYRQAIANSTTINAMIQHVVQIAGYEVVSIGRTYNGAQILKLKEALSLDRLQGIIQKIEGSVEVEYAEPDLRMLPLYTPNDPRYNEQWHYYETEGGIGLPAAWDLTQGENSVVAVLDTGYLPHKDLLPNLLPGFDMIGDVDTANDGDGRDDDALDPGDYAPVCGYSKSSWHGTHVAGTIAAVGNNRIGVIGAAFRAKILPVRVLGKCGGYLSDISDGIVWASGGDVDGIPANQNPANVINLSLAANAPTCHQTIQQAIDMARQLGTTILVAAGNDSQDSSSTSPANCDGVISVAATTRTRELAFFSNHGDSVDIAAPGDSILSTYNEGRISPGEDSYDYDSGTSMSVPQVSGVAAMLYTVKPDITPDEVEQILKATTRPFLNPCSGCGTGILDATAAVERARDETTDPEAPGLIMLKNGVVKAGIKGAVNAMLPFAIDVPAGATDLTFTLSGGSGDADLYVLFTDTPTLNNFECRPYLNGNEETCQIGNVQAGRYYLLLHAYEAFAGASLVATYRLESNGSEPGISFENQQDYPIQKFKYFGVMSPITVTRKGESGRFDVKVKIAHPYTQEIAVQLIDPMAHHHQLKRTGGAGGKDLSKNYSLDLGAVPMAGTWYLRVRDFGYRGKGYIDSWRITFYPRKSSHARVNLP